MAVSPVGYMQLFRVQMLVYRVQEQKMPVHAVPFSLPCNWEERRLIREICECEY